MNISASAGTTAPYPCKVQLEESSTLGPFIMVPITVSLKKKIAKVSFIWWQILGLQAQEQLSQDDLRCCFPGLKS